MIEGGTLDVSEEGRKISVSGSWLTRGGSFISRNGEVEFYGSGSIRSNEQSFNDVMIVVLSAKKTHYFLKDILNVGGDLVIVTGTLDASADDHKITVGGSWFNKGGTLLHKGNSKV